MTQAPEKVDPTPLGRPLTFEFSGKTAKNRFMKAAMSELQSSWDDKDLTKRGIPSKELANLYRLWGAGGYGVILLGNTMIEYDQLEGVGNHIIPLEAPFSGERFERFKDIASAAKEHGSLVYTQLSHPGRQVTDNIQPHPISASDVQLKGSEFGSFAKPRAMEQADIDHVVNSFAHAAEYCYKAGFDGVELHGAHGYLLAQFLAPSTNLRTDQYGGSLTNRARIIFEITDAIRARVPDKSFSIGIKLNSTEFQKGGFTVEDCKVLCAELEKNNFDWVELSGGTYESLAFVHKRESTKKREAYFIEFAEMIMPELKKTKAYITGGLRTAAGMVKALEKVDGVGIGRPAAHEFDLPQKILDGVTDGAIKQLIGEDIFMITNATASIQMMLAGLGHEPLDLSRPDHEKVIQRAIEKWLGNRQKGGLPGPLYIEGLELQPYGTAYAAA
ncbi:NADH:flavin oxidoreductase / NADH oxidase family domain-containing protein [Trichoderma breve]|uniref:NADH:flavin oxidoreductase / NADH oxidase family domain-containing protein n=1 Tax=Trichoderma breve TaxID=2034170 RepID=A0A9W9E6N9_9HYPO|nr:NADH:flavin oxidoreductase / NADH oxidase family domain-containing protein [Trichoderma breve]KAJ4856656.1 NADH:flavin oxidoreductase / NADH oxidase family domain-containing protein [Trichoderma breve]